MAKEIERKFLVATDEWRDEADGGAVFLQAYVVTMDDRSVRAVSYTHLTLPTTPYV